MSHYQLQHSDVQHCINLLDVAAQAGVKNMKESVEDGNFKSVQVVARMIAAMANRLADEIEHEEAGR